MENSLTYFLDTLKYFINMSLTVEFFQLMYGFIITALAVIIVIKIIDL